MIQSDDKTITLSKKFEKQLLLALHETVNLSQHGMLSRSSVQTLRKLQETISSSKRHS